MYLSIGLMSGTSMDGIDAALIETDGIFHIKELGSISVSYEKEFVILLKMVDYAAKQNNGDLNKCRQAFSNIVLQYLKQELCLDDEQINEKIITLASYLKNNLTFDNIVMHSTKLHVEIVKSLLTKFSYAASQISVIGYHGQTIFHDAMSKITVQIGDGEYLSEQTGISVVNDFRSLDVLNGGQGAPLAPLYHRALAIRDNKYPIAVINCGGIANITVVSGNTDTDIIGFDTGPGNGLIDKYIRTKTQGNETMDLNGQYGQKGNVNEKVLKILYEKSIQINGINYFEMKPPKSLDTNDMSLVPELNELSFEDACATLEAFTADTILNSINFASSNYPHYWILCGGGWKNPVILSYLKSKLIEKLGNDIQVCTADEFGWNSQAIEAQLFAYLAVRRLKNLPTTLPNTTGVSKPISGGTLHIVSKN